MEQFEEIIEMEAGHILNVFGEYDKYVKKLEKYLSVTIVDRDGGVRITGSRKHVEQTAAILNQLLELSKRGNQIQEQNVDYAIEMSMESNNDALLEIDGDLICHTVSGKPIKPKTLGQKQYVDAIRRNMIVFGMGPAGTGKTYLAMAMAITAFKNNEVERIILTRPAIEAGEKLGFLPGDLQSKVDPYLRPLYDALFDMLGAETYNKYLERGSIEVAPLAYMRGRTLDDSFIILDEAQNTSREQMKMFLTRMGVGSKVVVTGDVTQIDLPDRTRSGLVDALQVLKGVNGIAQCCFTEKDVVRHRLVQEIIKAYEAAAHPAKH